MTAREAVADMEGPPFELGDAIAVLAHLAESKADDVSRNTWYFIATTMRESPENGSWLRGTSHSTTATGSLTAFAASMRRLPMPGLRSRGSPSHEQAPHYLACVPPRLHRLRP
jgi:hypothetical protein